MQIYNLNQINHKEVKTARSKSWFIIFAGLLFVVMAQLIVSNMLASKGDEMVSLEKQIVQLGRENQNARQEMAEKASLAQVSRSIEQLGFVAPASIIYVDLTQPVASLQ